MYQRDVSHWRRMPDLGEEPHASVEMSGYSVADLAEGGCCSG